MSCDTRRASGRLDRFRIGRVDRQATDKRRQATRRIARRRLGGRFARTPPRAFRLAGYRVACHAERIGRREAIHWRAVIEFGPVEAGVPLPDSKRGHRDGHVNQWPFERMAVGDSFAVFGFDPGTAASVRLLAACAAGSWGGKRGCKFATRIVNGAGGLQVRVWRVR